MNYIRLFLLLLPLIALVPVLSGARHHANRHADKEPQEAEESSDLPSSSDEDYGYGADDAEESSD